MTTIRDRCRQIAAAHPDAPALPTPPTLAFDVLESQIDSEQATGANVVAISEGRLIASLFVRLREPGGFVHSLFVAPAYRGQGIAEQLLRLAALVAADHGKPTIGLSVHNDNAPAQRLYHRLGFRPFAPTQGSTTSTTWVAMLPLPDESL